jgi:antitoxin VapB
LTITIEFGPPQSPELKAAFEGAIRENHSLGAVWNLGRTLASQARKASSGVSEAVAHRLNGLSGKIVAARTVAAYSWRKGFNMRRNAAMPLNVKNDEAHRMAVELAGLTGESITRAVSEAIRQRLERERRRRDREALADALLEIGRRCAAHRRRDTRPHDQFLYDDRGLPA